MIKIIQNSFEILKQFLLFLFIFIVSLIVFSIISATLEKAHGAEYRYIKVPEIVFVKSADIFLGDIAEIHINDDSLRTFVKAINLGTAPLPGAWRFIKGSYLVNLIKARVENSFNIIVPEKVKIISKVVLVSTKEIEEKIIAFLKGTDTWKNRLGENGNLVLQGDLNLEAIAIPEREMNFKFKVATGDDLLGATNIELSIFDREFLFKKFWVRVNIAYSGEIIVANRDLRPGEVLNDAMLDRRVITIDNSPSRFFTAKELLSEADLQLWRHWLKKLHW